MAERRPDAVVVGSGPNGLAAAITLAQAGRSVTVLEAEPTIGGGTRSAQLTLPGFVHDICSTIHPLGLASPFFRETPLAEHGLRWIHPDAPLAHPFDDGTAAVLERSLDTTAEGLGVDARAYRRLMAPLLAHAGEIISEIMGPLRPPRHPLVLARFGMHAVRPAASLARSALEGHRARAMFAGMAAHAILPLERPATAAFGLVLGMLGHWVGWPVAAGGSQVIADAMGRKIEALGGEIQTGRRVASLADVPRASAVLFDLTPRQVLRIAGDRFSPRYRRSLERYRYGPAVFKVDWALDGPVPWKASECARAATVHVGGTLEEIADSEQAMATGRHHDRPFVILAQQSLFDPSRAPAGKHTVWAYCHVPSGSTVDMTERVERQVERFAPGFRDRIIARNVIPPAELERHNENYIGGDIIGGMQDLRQLFTRPAVKPNPYATSDRRLYFCSSSTPPGGGVHGMCGVFAAKTALRRAW